MREAKQTVLRTCDFVRTHPANLIPEVELHRFCEAWHVVLSQDAEGGLMLTSHKVAD